MTLSFGPYIEFGALFVFGTIIGSYLYTTALRISTQSSLGGRSFCDSCNQTLTPFSLIPILGYLVNRGKCGHCGANISIAYPIFEAFTGFCFGLLALHLGVNLGLVHILLLFSVFAVITLVDYWVYEIPTGPVVIGLTVHAAWLFYFQMQMVQTALIGLLVGAGIFHWVSTLFYYFRKKDGLGRGDATLLGFIGFWLGWQALIPVVFIASLLGVIGGALLLVFQGKSFQKEIAFGPWLILASAIVWGFPRLLEGLF